MIIIIFGGFCRSITHGFSVNIDQDFGGLLNYVRVFFIFLCNHLPMSIQSVGFLRDQCGVGAGLCIYGVFVIGWDVMSFQFATGWDVMSFHFSSCWFGIMLSEIV